MNNLSFSNPVSNRSGGKNVYFTDTLTKTVTGTIPFGVQEYKTNKTCDVQILEPSFFEDLDLFIVSEAAKNSFKWFNKSIHNSVIKELYKSPLRQNKNYPPLLKVKLYSKSGLNLENLEKGSTVEMNIRNTGIYFTPSSFGTGWTTEIVKVLQSPPKAPKLEGYSFIDEE